jgi:hypothetical protein
MEESEILLEVDGKKQGPMLKVGDVVVGLEVGLCEAVITDINSAEVVVELQLRCRD